MTTHATTDADTIKNAARACAQGWAEQAREDSAREWAGDVTDEDHAYVRDEVLNRNLTSEESHLFADTFRVEYAVCMRQKAERNGWDDLPADLDLPPTGPLPARHGDGTVEVQPKPDMFTAPPAVVHHECMPDGSSVISLSFGIKVF